MNARDELAEVAYIATSPSSEAEAQYDWNYLMTRTLQARERILAEPYRVADAILAAGYSKPRTITSAEELETLPVGSVIIDRDGDAWQRARAGWTCTDRAANTQNQPSSSLAYVLAPATVLYTPEES